MSKVLDKDLSLCIIVGPGEAFELKRCLESVKGELCDEILVTVTSDDAEVRAVAEEYADKVSYFKWCHDFGKARNYNFSQASGKYILWLDADDVVPPEDYKGLLEIKKDLHKYDMVLIDYIYAHDNNGKPIVVLPRERIVRNCDYIAWHDPIHEYLSMDKCKTMHRLEGVGIHHHRTKPFNPDRNLSLLKIEYEKPDPSARICFYYGKELFDTGKTQEGIEVLEALLDKGEGYRDNLAVAAIKVARHYYSLAEFDKAKTFAMKGIGFSPKYAENYVVLGDVSLRAKDFDTALKYYQDALGKKMDAGMSQLLEFYTFLPAANIALVHLQLKDYRKSLEYANLALTHRPTHSQMLEVKKTSEKELKKVVLDPTIKNMDQLVKALDDIGYDVSVESNREEHADLRISRKVDVSVAWLIPGYNMEDPATRIRRINVDKYLNARGVKSFILAGYFKFNLDVLKSTLKDYSVVVFTNHGEFELNLMKYLRSQGKKVLFDKCEALFDYPLIQECLEASDSVICCSTKLTEMVQEKAANSNAIYITDIVEKYEKRPTEQFRDRYERPKALYMGMGGNSFLAKEYLRPAIEAAGYDLVVITEWDDADKKWGLHSWANDMRECDVVLCPQRIDVQPAKSSVKATAAMALGMPVLCSPLQAYKELVVNGVNGFICEKLEDWTVALNTLKDPHKRELLGLNAYASAAAFLPEAVIKKYLGLFRSPAAVNKLEVPQKVEAKVSNNFKEPVDLIITNYNNVEYLKLMVSSILMNTTYPFNLIISDAGSGEDTWEYLRTLRGIRVLGSPDKRLNFSEACNAGIAVSKQKYFAILNSDLIVSKGWLTNIVTKMDSESRLAACGVLSNCDRGWLHDNPRNPKSPKYNMQLGSGLELVPGMKIGQIKDKVEELYDFMAQSNKDLSGKFVEQQWVAAYATIFARSAIDEVGLFDPVYKNGCEDLDLCRRLTAQGYRIGQALDSFVYHFGGISRYAYQSENREEYNKEDKLNHLIYQNKWQYKKVVIYTGPAWEPWTKETVDKGMAGSETWAAYLAIAFAKRGYGVIIYNDLPEKDRGVYLKEEYEVDKSLFRENEKIEKGYVAYRHHAHMLNDLKYDVVDYFISSRTVEPFKHAVRSMRRYVMIHDIWLSQDKKYDILSWKVDGYGYLSEWHREFLKSHHNIPDDKMFKTSNGVNFDLYKDVDKIEKKNQIVYSSSPDRGLLELLKMFPKFREVCPDMKLVVAYGFYNWESAVKARGDEKGKALIMAIKEAMDQPGVEYVGRVSKDVLANYQKESKWWFYPSWFTETFCIGSAENGLAKNALLASNLAGLKTTVGNAGILVDGDSHSEAYQDAFVASAIRLLTDEDLTRELAEKAYTKMQEYSWNVIADEWMKLFGLKF